MSCFVNKYVRTCHTCSCAKTSRHCRYGVLQPLLIPERPWASISMDSIEKLPTSSGYDSILIVVDCLTKMAIFIPTTTLLSAWGLADLFV